MPTIMHSPTKRLPRVFLTIMADCFDLRLSSWTASLRDWAFYWLTDSVPKL